PSPYARNACKTRVLPGTRSVSDRLVGPPPREAETDRFLHTFAQVFILDPGGDRASPLRVLRAHLERRPRRLLRGLRQRPGSEADLRHTEGRGDLHGALAQLVGPHRIRRRDLNRAVLRDARRPRVARDRGPDGGRPAFNELCHPGLRTEPRQLGANLVSERIQAPPPPAGRVRAATLQRASP